MCLRKTLILIFACCVFQQLNAQIVSIIPRFPKITDSLTIVFDATKGNGALKDCTAIYIHTGVVTPSPTSTAWSSVPMAWGSADPRWRMTNLGGNKFEIKYKPTNFYGIASSAVVYRMGFVFRNRSGSVTGKTESNSDIFSPVYQPGQQAVAFLQPSSKTNLSNYNQTFSYVGASSVSGNLQVLVDGNLVNQVANDTVINGLIPTNQSGTRKVLLRMGETNQFLDSISVTVNPAIETASLPSGLDEGLNIISPTSVVLCLRAPNKQFVYVRGEFNNWQLKPFHFMKRSPDGKQWWVQIDNLDPAKTYTYQYFVDGLISIADPYSKIILNPSDDPYIGNSIYPNL